MSHVTVMTESCYSVCGDESTGRRKFGAKSNDDDTLLGLNTL